MARTSLLWALVLFALVCLARSQGSPRRRYSPPRRRYSPPRRRYSPPRRRYWPEPRRRYSPLPDDDDDPDDRVICSPNCFWCHTSFTCQVCYSGYTNIYSQCYSCGHYCYSCDYAGPSKCDHCNSGYMLSYGACYPCTAHCSECHNTTSTGCDSCNWFYELQNGACVFQPNYVTIPIAVLGGCIACFVCLCGVAALLEWLCRLCPDLLASVTRSRSAPARQAFISSEHATNDGDVGVSMPTRISHAQPANTGGTGVSTQTPKLPSGMWKGYYTQKQRQHDVCQFVLNFGANDSVHGNGVDDVGAYRIHGSVQGEQISFEKTYQRYTRNSNGIVSEDNEGHTVMYRGAVVGASLGAGFRGSWSIRNMGTNDDGIFHLWPAMQDWSAPPEAPPQTVFEVAEGGECVVCFDRPIQTCLLPCGHIALCVQCESRLTPRRCPICRADIQTVTRKPVTNAQPEPDAAQALRSQ